AVDFSPAFMYGQVGSIQGTACLECAPPRKGSPPAGRSSSHLLPQGGRTMSDLKNVKKPEDLSQEDLARFVVDALHRVIVHYTMWFMETEHQVGMPKALNILREVRKNSYNIQMDRLAKTMGFEMKDGVPKVLAETPKDKLI